MLYLQRSPARSLANKNTSTNFASKLKVQQLFFFIVGNYLGLINFDHNGKVTI